MTEQQLRLRRQRKGWRALLAGALTGVALGLGSARAEPLKPFPKHWGEPAAIQTHDYVEWPAGYGHGSSTVAHWIKNHMQQDAESARTVPAPILYAAKFDPVDVGHLPEDFLVLNGDFAVREIDGVKLLELPGSPLDSFAVMFGPAGSENMGLKALIQGTSRGRRYPSFAIGLNGLGGYRLRLAPARGALELFKGPEEGGETAGSIPFEWKSGEWTWLHLQVRKTGESEWRVEGKAWLEGHPEPADWMVATVQKDKPLPGRPFVAASPFSGTPIRFNQLVVTQPGVQSKSEQLMK